MHSSLATLGSLSLMAAVGLAAPLGHGAALLPRQDSGSQVVVYWGQNGGSTTENADLSTYCTEDAGVDVVVLSFLYQYGNGVTVPSGNIGPTCFIDTDGQPQLCDQLAGQIQTCKDNGVKVILSLGGASGAYSLSSAEEASTIGQNLWNAYGNSGNGTVPRPFGKTFVDGWDMDIESNSGNQYYKNMLETLRSNFAKDPSNTYYITGAPQCPVPEPNMGGMVTTAQFDYLWVQFYNNEGCSTDGEINFNDWKNYIANTPSSDATIVIGVPASPDAATGTASGAQYYLEPDSLSDLVSQYKDDSAFGGIMMWSAGFSDANVNNGCTYAQEAKSILDNGSAC
jgi:chitinase